MPSYSKQMFLCMKNVTCHMSKLCFSHQTKSQTAALPQRWALNELRVETKRLPPPSHQPLPQQCTPRAFRMEKNRLLALYR